MIYRRVKKHKTLGFGYITFKPILDSFLYFFIFVKNLFVYGGYLPALWGPAFVITVSLTFNVQLDLRILGISFLLPLVIYSHDYHKDLEMDEETNPERAAFLKKKWSFPLTIGYLFLLSGLLFWVWNIWIFILVIALLATGIMYSTVIKGITKRVPGFKNLCLALIWSSWGTLLVVLNKSLNLNYGVLVLSLFFYTKVLINTIFFDIKDAKTDKKEGLKTLPACWWIKPTIKLLKILNTLTVLLLLLGIYLNCLPMIALSLLPFSIYTHYYLKKGANHGKMSSKLFFADIEALCYPLILLFVRLF